jgi:hypothetical protein
MLQTAVLQQTLYYLLRVQLCKSEAVFDEYYE